MSIVFHADSGPLLFHAGPLSPATRANSPPSPCPDELRRLFVDRELPIRGIAGQDRHPPVSLTLDPVLAALATDPQVIALLRRHQIRWPPHGDGASTNGLLVIGLTRPFLQQGYQQIGLSIDHITLLTGRSPSRLDFQGNPGDVRRGPLYDWARRPHRAVATGGRHI